LAIRISAIIRKTKRNYTSKNSNNKKNQSLKNMKNPSLNLSLKRPLLIRRARSHSPKKDENVPGRVRKMHGRKESSKTGNPHISFKRPLSIRKARSLSPKNSWKVTGRVRKMHGRKELSKTRTFSTGATYYTGIKRATQSPRRNRSKSRDSRVQGKRSPKRVMKGKRRSRCRSANQERVTNHTRLTIASMGVSNKMQSAKMKFRSKSVPKMKKKILKKPPVRKPKTPVNLQSAAITWKLSYVPNEKSRLCKNDGNSGKNKTKKNKIPSIDADTKGHESTTGDCVLIRFRICYLLCIGD